MIPTNASNFNVGCCFEPFFCRFYSIFWCLNSNKVQLLVTLIENFLVTILIKTPSYWKPNFWNPKCPEPTIFPLTCLIWKLFCCNPKTKLKTINDSTIKTISIKTKDISVKPSYTRNVQTLKYIKIEADFMIPDICMKGSPECEKMYFNISKANIAFRKYLHT